jgi:serine/threonine-protein kinase
MELVPGRPLAAVMADEGAIAPERTLGIVGQAAAALRTAHEGGVIHRDVKPGNLLVTPDDTVKITDFGIARATNAVPLTLTGAIMGTAYYISPEQASGEAVTPASDVYSLGVVAYECLTGRRPFDGNTPVSVALAQVKEEPPAFGDGVPAPVADLVMRMLAKDAAGRPSTAELAREAAALRAAAPGWPDAATKALPVADGDATRRLDPPVAARGRGSDTDPGFLLPPLRNRPAWLPYAIAAAAVLVLVLVTARACAGPDTAPTGDRASSSASAPETVTVDQSAYVGRPLDAVRSELTALGLTVSVEQSEGGGDPGTVKEVTPDGAVPAGGQVTVVAVASAETGGNGNDDEKGKGEKGEDKEKDKEEKDDDKKGDE